VMYQYGHHGAGGWGFLMILGMLAFWALLIVVGVAVYRLVSAHPQPPAAPVRTPDAEHVLAQRFASGEIDQTEYAARLAVLREHHPQ
jgi:putative membrane protein